MAVDITYNSDILALYQTFYTNKQVDLTESLAWLIADEKSMGNSEEQSNLIVHLANFYFDVIEALRYKITGNYFLPSKDALQAMYDELYLYGLGNFAQAIYWSSSEYNATLVHTLAFYDGTWGQGSKSRDDSCTRPYRTFISSIIYALRDIGPGGGYIFAIDGDTYYEAAVEDESAVQPWSNVQSTAVTGTDTILESGEANTALIIAQVNHTLSAASICYAITYTDYIDWLTDDEAAIILSKRTILEY